MMKKMGKGERLLLNQKRLVWCALVFASALFFLAVSASGNNLKRNDEIVQRLRQELTANGAHPLPDPPRELGVHTACIKHGKACPDSYVEFLQRQRDSSGKPSDATSEEQAAREKTKNKRQESPAGNAGQQGSWEPPDNRGLANDAQLENLRRLRTVLSDRLTEQLSRERQWQCKEAVWFRRGLNFALVFHHWVVGWWWNFVMYKLLPCTLLTVVLVWVFFGDRIPYQHLRGLLASDPAFVMNDVLSRRNRSLSVAELVMERESYKIAGPSDVENCGADDTSCESGPSKAQSQELNASYRRDRWFVTRFALLEAHEEHRMMGIVLKLRLVLSAAIFILLVWTLFSLPMRAADLHNNGADVGLLQYLFAMLSPAWMTTSLALYMGWSWIGGMIAYAGWEIVSAGEALLRSGERAAALHEKILQRWCS